MPPWLPSEVIDDVLELFEREMGRAFYHLYLWHEEDIKKSRSLSGSSMGSVDSQPFTDDDQWAMLAPVSERRVSRYLKKRRQEIGEALVFPGGVDM
jgi:hypothetical protein